MMLLRHQIKETAEGNRKSMFGTRQRNKWFSLKMVWLISQRVKSCKERQNSGMYVRTYEVPVKSIYTQAEEMRLQ